MFLKNCTALILLYFIIYSNISGQAFNTRHFEIQQLSPGVYVAIAKNGGHAICNAGIIDMGDFTIILDPFMSLDAAWDLKMAAHQLTGSPVRYVINSHYHNDHVGGNQVFSGASIISTSRTRELERETMPDEIEFAKTRAAEVLKENRQQDTTSLKGHALDEYHMWIGYFEAYVNSADSLRVTLPDLTFQDSLVIQGSKRNVKLISLGEGHTESDLFLYLPEENIAFLGDLLFIQNQPWLGESTLDHKRSYMAKILDMHINTLVPGHGPVGGVDDIKTQEEYMLAVENAARRYHDQKIVPDKSMDIQSPAPYNTWFLSRFYKSNVLAIYDQLYGQKNEGR